MQNLTGKIIDNYKIISVLGEGGMGIVYKAYDTILDRNIAIKMLRAQIFDKKQSIQRFKIEAKNQAKLSHPNIVMVHGFIEYFDLLGIVMEYVDGESLDKILLRKRRFSLEEVIFILKQVLQGVGYVHSKGFVHKDIKPSNIILSNEGVTKIMDFGISKSLFETDAMKTVSKFGTAPYMSPEQIEGKEITHRSDIYSIGCTAYEMITGHPPFYSRNEFEVLEGHLRKTPQSVSEKNPGISEWVDKILLKALEKNPYNRYNSCKEMHHDIQAIKKHSHTLFTTKFNPQERTPKSSKLASFFIFLFFIVLIIALSYFVYKHVNFTTTPDPKVDSTKQKPIERFLR